VRGEPNQVGSVHVVPSQPDRRDDRSRNNDGGGKPVTLPVFVLAGDGSLHLAHTNSIGEYQAKLEASGKVENSAIEQPIGRPGMLKPQIGPNALVRHSPFSTTQWQFGAF
jgi:hypothetical protein